MSIIYFLIPIAIIFVVIAIAIFFWAVRSEQFQDLERHGHSILFDDDVKKPDPERSKLRRETSDMSEEIPNTNSRLQSKETEEQ